VEGRADVEAHRDPVEPGHDQVLQACTLQLLRRAKNLRADEPGHVVDDRPVPGLTLDVARNAVSARLQRHHVDALRRAVCYGRSLSGLKVMRAEPTGQLRQFIDVQSDHPDERLARAGQALKTDVDARPRPGLVLLDDVGEHAEASGEVQPPNDALEQLLQPHDGVELVGGGIETDDDVPAPVAEPVEDREQNLFLIVSCAVRLNP